MDSAGFAPPDEAARLALRQRALVGTADRVWRGRHELAVDFDLDEIVVNTWCDDPDAWRRSMTLLADAAC